MRHILSVALLLSMILLVIPALASGNIVGESYSGTVESIEVCIKLGDYEYAMSLAESFLDTKNRQPDEISVIQKYVMYTQSLLTLKSRRYQEAIIAFQSLAATNFSNSALYWHYTEGLQYLEKAKEARNPIESPDLDTAIQAFMQAGGIEDTAMQLKECYRIMLNPPAPTSITMKPAKASVYGLHIEWDDELADNKYTLQYAPRGIKPIVITTTDTSIMLNDLIPNTEYMVIIQESISGSSATASYRTLEAPNFKSSSFVVTDTVLGRYSQADLNSRGLSTLVERDKFEVVKNDTSSAQLIVSQESVKFTGYGYVLYTRLQFDKGSNAMQEVKVSIVLRLGDKGAYKKSFRQKLSESYIIRVFDTIDDLLDAFYMENDGWPAASGRVEFYINDMLAGFKPVIITEQK
ncbi:hypothetical protein AGMMS49992_15890 [Clostridia bacterium]|nr:hypothetical protein AGMMS49992_15890 [Clostridia bacterium]